MRYKLKMLQEYEDLINIIIEPVISVVCLFAFISSKILVLVVQSIITNYLYFSCFIKLPDKNLYYKEC